MKPPTLRLYARGAAELLQALGEDVGQWTAHAVRNFLLQRASQCGAPTTQKLITSLRAFLRYLNFHGESRDDLALAIPAVAHWRLAKLPRCLSAEEVNRLIAACDGTDPGRLRDRAIVLMLVRLGLRSGDVAQLRLTDIDWNNGTLQVIGKGRYQVRLPLPQDVGDAVLRYLESRPAHIDTDHVFVRSIAPYRSFASGDGVSSVVKILHVSARSVLLYLLATPISFQASATTIFAILSCSKYLSAYPCEGPCSAAQPRYTSLLAPSPY